MRRGRNGGNGDANETKNYRHPASAVPPAAQGSNDLIASATSLTPHTSPCPQPKYHTYHTHYTHQTQHTHIIFFKASILLVLSLLLPLLFSPRTTI